jgi:hypothetical protein
MWQQIAVAVIVLVALVYASWQLSKPWRGRPRKDGAGCGTCGDCDGCSAPAAPQPPPSAKVAGD